MLILEGHQGPVRCVAYSRDGRWLVSGDEEGKVRLWNLAHGGGRVVAAVETSVEAVTFTPDDNSVVIGTADGIICVKGVVAEAKDAYQFSPNNEAIRSLSYSPNGSHLAVFSWDHRIMVWSAAGALKGAGCTWQTIDEDFTACAFHPVEPYLFVGGTTSIQQLPLSGDSGRMERAHGCAPIVALALSPNGRLMAIGHTHGTVQLLEAGSYACRATLDGHTWTVYSLAFTPDGRTLLSGSADGTVRLWDVATARQRHCYRWHKRWVTCAALAPDGMTAAAGSDDATIVVWDLDE